MPGNVPVAMTIVNNPADNTEVMMQPKLDSTEVSKRKIKQNNFMQVIPMQETLEVRLKESTYQVVSDDWSYVKIENLLEPKEDDYSDSAKSMEMSSSQCPSQSSSSSSSHQHQHQQQQQNASYTTASQASQHSQFFSFWSFYN